MLNYHSVSYQKWRSEYGISWKVTPSFHLHTSIHRLICSIWELKFTRFRPYVIRITFIFKITNISQKSISCGFRIKRSRRYFQVDQTIKVNFANQTFWSRSQALLQDKQMWLPLDTEYHCANTDVLFQLRFIDYAMVSPFVLASLSLSMVNEKVRNHWRGVNKL